MNNILDEPSNEITVDTTLDVVSAEETGKKLEEKSSKFGINVSDSNICRICLFNGSVGESVTKCPCSCRGTMGYIHESCLRQWTIYHRSNICEICNQQCMIDNRTCSQLIRHFFTIEYMCPIAQGLLHIVTITPLIYYNIKLLGDVINSLETRKDITILPILHLMHSSFLLNNYLEVSWQIFDEVRMSVEAWWYNFSVEEYSQFIVSNDRSNDVDFITFWELFIPFRND